MTTFLSILAALVVLSVLVFVHELGHFIAGRLLGFKILEFSIGMGPQILKKEKNGIVYSLRALPIGGMCKFYGEDEGDDNKDFFSAKPVWKRIIVVAAGPVMNVLFSVVFAAITVISYGDIVYRPAIAGFSEEITTAADSGLMEGDILLEADGMAIEGSYNYSVAIDNAINAIKSASPEGDVTIVVDRGGEEVSLIACSLYDEASGQNMLGVSVGVASVRVKYGFFESIGHSLKYIGNIFSEYISFFGRLFKGDITSNDVGGTIMIIDLLQQAVREGFETVLRIAVILSLSLGIMNALPIPALDGGRLLFMLIELIFRKPIPAKVEGIIHFVGFVLLMVLMVFLVYLDITKIAG